MTFDVFSKFVWIWTFLAEIKKVNNYDDFMTDKIYIYSIEEYVLLHLFIVKINYIQFRQSFAKETFSYDEYLKS